MFKKTHLQDNLKFSFLTSQNRGGPSEKKSDSEFEGFISCSGRNELKWFSNCNMKVSLSVMPSSSLLPATMVKKRITKHLEIQKL